MTIYFSTEFFTQTPLLFNKLDPTADYKHYRYRSVIKCRNHESRNQKLKNPQSIKLSTENRNTQIQFNDFDEANFMSMLNRSVRVGNYNEALYLVESMVKNGCSPNLILCTKLIQGLFSVKKAEKAAKVMRLLEKFGEPDVFVYNVLIRGFCEMNMIEEAIRALNRMIDRGIVPDVATYSTIMSFLCQDGRLKEAINLFEIVKEKGITPSAFIYDPLVSAACKEGILDLAIDLLDDMKSNGCSPDMRNYNPILSTLCKNGNFDLAMEVLEKLSEIGSPNVITYNAMMSALWTIGERTKAFSMVSQMIEKGIDPDEVTYCALISYLCKGKMVDEALEVLKVMEACGYPPNVITYNTVLIGLCKAHRLDEAIDILQEMCEKGCRPNENTYVVLIRCIGCQGWRVEAMEVANVLFQINVISNKSLLLLRTMFPIFDASVEQFHMGTFTDQFTSI